MAYWLAKPVSIRPVIFLVIPALQVGFDATAEPVNRIGAFQCLVCRNGGFLEGTRSGSHGRIRENFPADKKLCVSLYEYFENELFVHFRLDDQVWPEEGAWTSKQMSRRRSYFEDGQLFVPLDLGVGAWPGNGEWGVKASSWNAACRFEDPQSGVK